MKKSYLSFLTYILISILYLGCKKIDTNNASKAYLIDNARGFFSSEILTNSAETQSAGLNSTNTNPRKQSAKSPIWEEAGVIRLSIGNAVIVPVRYNSPILLSGNFNKKTLYTIDDISKLLIYKDKNQVYHAEMITLLPDSNYSPNNLKPYSGFALIEDWLGNFLKEYKFGDGTIKKLGSMPILEQSVSQTTVNGESSKDYQPDLLATVEVCYSIDEYNYSLDDPNGGIYSSETLGCTNYFFDDGGSGGPAGLSGQDYGAVGAGSPLSPSANLVVYGGNDPITDVAQYIKCFQNIAYSSYSVTLYVRQPVPGTRAVYTLGPNSRSFIYNVGHTFLVFQQSGLSGVTTRAMGLYPATSVNPFSPSDPASLNNDQGLPFDIGLTITLTGAEFMNILNTCASGNSVNYNLNSNNCSTWALTSLAAGGISIHSTPGTWPMGGGYDPGDLGEDIRSMQLAPNMVRNIQGGDAPNNAGTCP